MKDVPGETLSRLLRLSRARKEPVPFDIAATIVAGVLAGLHAAHEATDDRDSHCRSCTAMSLPRTF